MKNFLLFSVILCGIVVFCGCEKPHPPPPVASTELMVRFFASMRKGDHASAVQQGVKLYALDKSQEAVIQLVMLEQANQYVEEAQKALNSGDLNRALSVLSEGMKKYPENMALPQHYRRVRQLRNVKALIDAMERAKNSASMSASLTAARIGLAANSTPELKAYFKEYEKRIEEVRKNEKKIEKTPSIVEPAIELSKPGDKK